MLHAGGIVVRSLANKGLLNLFRYARMCECFCICFEWGFCVSACLVCSGGWRRRSTFAWFVHALTWWPGVTRGADAAEDPGQLQKSYLGPKNCSVNLNIPKSFISFAGCMTVCCVFWRNDALLGNGNQVHAHVPPAPLSFSLNIFSRLASILYHFPPHEHVLD